MTKKLSTYLGLMIGALFLFVAGIGPALAVNAPAASPLHLTAKEKAWLAEHKTVRVAFDGHFPPYSFLNDDSKIEGLAVDILNVLADRVGITLEISPKTVWKELYAAAQKREVDLVATMGHQPERAQWFNFTQPYIFKSLVIMTRGGTTTINKPEDLAGKKVALVEKYQYVKPLLQQYPTIKPYYVETMLDGLNAVAVGKADAAITFIGAAYFLQNKYQIAGLKMAAIFERDRFNESIAVRNDWPELATILDKALDSVSGQEMQSLQERWLPKEVAASSRIILTEAEKSWIRKHPLIRIGVNPEFAPYAYLADDGAFSGIAADYIKLLNARLGLNMQAVPGLTWKEVVAKVKKREIDVIPGLAVNEERKGYLDFSEPYANFYRVIITRNDAPFLGGIEDLSKLRVAVQADTAHETFLKGHPDIKVFPYQTLQDALLAVSNGQADALIHNLASATFWITNRSLANLKVAAPVPGGDGTLHVTVRKDWPELVSIINKGLASITPEEKLEIQRRWVTVEYKTGIERRRVYISLVVLLGVILLGGAGFILWNRTLRRAVSIKTAELQESEARFRTIYNSTNDALFIHDPDSGAILDVNDKACELFGLTRQELQQSRVGDISADLPPYTQKEAVDWLHKAAAGTPQLFEWQARGADGRLFWIEVNMRCAVIGKKEIVLVSARDITERKKVRQELERYRHLLKSLSKSALKALYTKQPELGRSQTAMQYLLEDVNEANKQLEQANERLKEVDRLKSMFIASMSHELRTPLNSVIGFSSILHQRVGRPGERRAEKEPELDPPLRQTSALPDQRCDRRLENRGRYD